MGKKVLDGYQCYYQDNEFCSVYNQSQVWLGVILKNKNLLDDNSVENYEVVDEILFKNPVFSVFSEVAINVLDDDDSKYKECHINRNGNVPSLYYRDNMSKYVKDSYVVVPYREFYYDKIKSIILDQHPDEELTEQDFIYFIDQYINTKIKALITKTENDKSRTK